MANAQITRLKQNKHYIKLGLTTSWMASHHEIYSP